MQPVLDLDEEIEKELKKFSGDGPDSKMHEFALPQAVTTPELGDHGLMPEPRGSGNDMQFWFAG